VKNHPGIELRYLLGARSAALWLLVVIAFLTACAPPAVTYGPLRSVGGSRVRHVEREGYKVYSGFIRTTSRLPRKRPATCRVDVILDGHPGIPYEVLGYISVERVGPRMARLRGGEEQAVGWLRAKACRVGASAIFDVRTESEWFEAQRQTVRSVSGTAVAVYYLPEKLWKTRGARGTTSPFKAAPKGGQKGQRRMKNNPFRVWLE